MVRLSQPFSIPLDSVHRYGSNVTLLVGNAEGEAYGGTAKRARRTSRRRTGRDPRVDLLPRAAGARRVGCQWRMDRQPDFARTLPAGFHRRGSGGVVLRWTAHLPA